MKKLLSIFISIVMLFTVIGSMTVARAEEATYSILEVKDKIRTVGRTEDVESGIACDWTASGIEFTAVCEENASIALTVYANAECYFTVFIDDVRQDYRVRTLSGTYTPVIASAENGLTAGTHKIKIIKQTERTVATVNIKSFVLNNAALGDKPEEPQYIFESIGDSITSGFGSLDTNNQAAKYSDGTRTYAFITAQNFGAESRVTSVSGGTINSLYSQYIKNTRDDNAFDYSAYKKPNVVTIAFGTNDGAKTVDYWQTGIKNFADAIRTGYNDYTIPIVMVQNLMTNDDSVRANIAQAVKNLESLDAEKYSSIFVTYGTNPTGGHPAQANHKSVANKLTRDLVEFGIMPASALRSDATVTLTEKTTLEESLNKFDSVVSPGSTVTGITGELVSPLDPADAESETAKAVKYTADGTQSATTDYRYPQVRVGTVTNKNDTETYRTKGISFYINYKDTTDYTDVEDPTLSKPQLLLSSGDKKATVTLDVEDGATQKVEIYWSTMPNTSYVFTGNLVYSNNVNVNLEMSGACEYTIDNVKVLLNKYTYTENADCAYTYTAGYSSYEVIGILDGYEEVTTVVTTTSTSTTTSTTTTTKATETTSTVTSTPGAEYTKVLDFDNNMTSVTLTAANANSVTGGVINYAEVDESYTDGNVLKMDAVKWTNFGFSIGNVLKDKKVKSISYTVWSDDSQSWVSARTGIGNSSVSSLALTASGSFGYSSSIGITSTPKTITYDFSKIAPSVYNTISNAYMVFANNSANIVVYIDNIVITYQKYAGTFTGGADGDQVVYADENGNLTTPNATIADGEFAGWVTEDDADTIIPANTKLTLVEDTTYFAVATTRGEQSAPEAPVVESKTANSVTLVANENYQYSKDGETWQNSNVFSGLLAGTEYTFYQRLKATPTQYASPASEVTTVTTNAVYKWNLYSDSFKINSGATLAGGFNTQYKNDGTYFVSTGNAIGATATLTSLSTVKSGVYAVKFYARAAGARANIDISVNGTKVASDLNTGNTGTGSGLDYGFDLSNVEIVDEDQPITLTITTTTEGNLYLNSIELTKIADVDLSVTTAMVSGASIRLGGINGIRFYTKVDTAKIAALRSAGYTVELGTLIAPADNIKDTELSFNLETGKYVDVKFNSTTYYTDGEFSGIVGSLVNIKDTNITRDFVGRGYVKVTDKD
ncbi:MAG: GDSL-type esterase/lipase family protein, partial [Acutalibacteraceae bacterium]